MFELLTKSVLVLFAFGQSAYGQRRIRCFEAPSINNSECYKDGVLQTPQQMQGVFNPGETVTYKCLPGFVMEGEAVVTCQPNGAWTPRPRCNPIATPIPCKGVPPTGVNCVPMNDDGIYQLNDVVACQCGGGFNGVFSGRCTLNGTWSTWGTCQTATTTRPAITCRGLPTAANIVCAASRDDDSYAVNDEVDCKCGEGYTGSVTRAKCNIRGQWNNLPTCRIAPVTTPAPVCQGLPVLDNAVCTAANEDGIYRANSVVTCTCSEGFSGASTARCGVNGRWTGLPVCRAIPTTTLAPTCQGLPTVANIICESSNDAGVFRVNEKISCRCAEGFTGTSTATCSNRGQWMNLPTCRAIPTTRPPPTCEGLPTVANAVCDPTNEAGIYRANEKVACRCAEGFTGSSSATCNNRGQWTNLPTCRPIPTTTPVPTCEGLPTVANLICDAADAVRTYRANEKVACRCAEGFTGSSTITCNNRGQWIGLPTCRAIPTTAPTPTCETPLIIENGECASLEGQVYRNNMQINCSCNEGFRLSNQGWAKCNNARWINVPSCNKFASCVAPSLENGNCAVQAPNSRAVGARVVSSVVSANVFEVGASLTCTCQPTFKLVGQSTVRCQQSGEWSQLPICSQRLCFAAPSIANSQCYHDTTALSAEAMASSVFKAGEFVTYQCLDGFTLSGSSVVTCQEDGSWTKLPSCNRNNNPPPGTTARPTCLAPPQIAGTGCDNCDANGTISSSISFTIGMSIRYQCRPGYQMTGNPVITCQRDGTWSTLPVCLLRSTTQKLITCPPPLPIEGSGCLNCARSIPVYIEGDLIRYTCVEGYELVSDNEGFIECLSSGKWSTSPRCIRITATTVRGNSNVRG